MRRFAREGTLGIGREGAPHAHVGAELNALGALEGRLRRLPDQLRKIQAEHCPLCGHVLGGDLLPAWRLLYISTRACYRTMRHRQ